MKYLNNDLLINWIVFYAVLAILKPYNGGINDDIC